MTDNRRLRSIQTRYDIEIDRWSFPLRRQRWRLTWICGLVSLLVCIPLLLVDHRVFESRPVSRPHQIFEQNCKACHDSSWQPLVRLATLDNSVHSVSDRACQQCHRQTNEDHLVESPGGLSLVNLATPVEKAAIDEQFSRISCAGCHQEHRGKDMLSHVSDQYCARCHLAMDSTSIPTPFFQKLSTFDQHIEFAAVREIKDRSTMQRHPSALLSRFENGKLLDNVAFRFNHHLHLDPELRGGGNKSVTLNCQDCHVADESGAYFKPIRFEDHCQRCHVLGTKATGELPHVTPEIVRGMLLERLAKTEPFAATLPKDVIGGPTKPPVEIPASLKDSPEWKGLQAELSRLEEILFGTSAAAQEAGLPPRMNRLEMTCTKCHLTQSVQEDGVTWKVIPPRIPDRWYPNSHFNHKAHGAVSCVDCHTRSAMTATPMERDQFYPAIPADLKDSPSIYASVSAEDVLMPGIQVCRNCHGASRTEKGAAAARSDCFECHVYHHPAKKGFEHPLMRQILADSPQQKFELRLPVPFSSQSK